VTTRVGIRELRNNTSSVIEQATQLGEVIITSNGEDVAILKPLASAWSRTVDTILNGLPDPVDTGWADELAADDAQSIEDLA